MMSKRPDSISSVAMAAALMFSVLAVTTDSKAQESRLDSREAQDAAESLATSLFRASASAPAAEGGDADTAKRRAIGIQALSRAAADADQLARDIDAGRSLKETRAHMARLRDLDELLRVLGPEATRGLPSKQYAQAILVRWNRLQEYHAGR